MFRPDRRGHGRTPAIEGLLTYEQMAQHHDGWTPGSIDLDDETAASSSEDSVRN